MCALINIHQDIKTLEATLTLPDSRFNRLDVLCQLKQFEIKLAFDIDYGSKADIILNDSKEQFVRDITDMICDIKDLICVTFN